MSENKKRPGCHPRMADMKLIRTLVKTTKSCATQRIAMQSICDAYTAKVKTPKPVSVGWLWQVLVDHNLLSVLPCSRNRKPKGANGTTKVRVHTAIEPAAAAATTQEQEATKEQTVVPYAEVSPEQPAHLNSVEQKLYAKRIKK